MESSSARHYIESDTVEGTAVYDVNGDRVGAVRRLIIDNVSGQVAFVVVRFNSFFELGADNHAVAWSNIRFEPDLGGYRTDVTQEELRAAPDFVLEGDHDPRTFKGERPFHAYWRIPASSRAI